MHNIVSYKEENTIYIIVYNIIVLRGEIFKNITLSLQSSLIQLNKYYNHVIAHNINKITLCTCISIKIVFVYIANCKPSIFIPSIDLKQKI